MARRRPKDALRYALRGREISNFTYEIANEDELPGFVASVLGIEPERVQAHLDELGADSELIDELRERLAGDRRRNPEPLLGKRRVLYCVVRAEHPGVVAESGVHDGLGTAVILRALERNAEEGSPGRLHAFDLNPDAGWLVDADRHAERFTLHVGDARETLEPALARDGVDFLVHDSLKTHAHESFELEAAVRHHRDGRLVLYTDDASSTGALAKVCKRNEGRSATLWEQPDGHFWRGNELGLCCVESAGPARP